MAFTSYASLLSKLDALEVTGISSRSSYRYAPTILTPARLPLKYPRVPTASRANSTLGYHQGLKVGVVELVVIVSTITLNLQDNNLDLAVALMDELCTSLEANAEDLGMDTYSIAFGDEVTGETPVWVLVATITVSG